MTGDLTPQNHWRRPSVGVADERTDPAASPGRDSLGPAGRLRLLCEAGSLRLLTPEAARRPVAVVAGVGRVNGREVVSYAQDSTIGGGSVGTAESETVVRALRLARRMRAPVVGFMESAGARLQEGAAALGGFGRIFYENVSLSGRAPQISVITGTSAGGGCYSPALTDFIVMTRPAAMFLTGPKVVREALGEDVTADALGGADVHQRNGVCQFVARDDREAIAIVRELLRYLREDSRSAHRPQPPAAEDSDPGKYVPDDTRRVYDVRDVLRSVMDHGRFLEVSARWARNLVVGFGRLEGRGVGIVASQPRYLGGVLDVDASEKGARFVDSCNTFGLPLLVFVDTPGFMPGIRQESAGIIRHGAQLVRAFASAAVPRVTVVLRKAYGGAYITMNAKDLGADCALAWVGAEIGIMGARSAIHIVHRRELAEATASDALADRLAEQYAARNIAAHRAHRLGLIDDVIQPHETRRRLAASLREAHDRRESVMERRARHTLSALRSPPA